jgi:purine nucleosidase
MTINGRFPTLPDDLRLGRLATPRDKVRVVIDTDTYNEIDDQYALAYALLAPERIELEALYAAPFQNDRAGSAAEGMEKSHEEILRLLERLDVSPEGLVHRGSTSFLRGVDEPERNAAVDDLIERALASPDDDPLYVVAIGAITNVTSAMLIEPRIIEHIVVLWLGGHALHWPHNREFNLHGDVLAAQVALDSGVPFVRFPCAGVTTHLRTSPPEVARYVEGQGAIGDYLAETFYDYDPQQKPGWSKVIWDIVTIAYLVDATWTPSDIVHTPILTDQLTWSFDDSRHLMRSVNYVKRNEIFGDLFRRLAERAR